MPFALILIGLAMVMSAVNNRQVELGNLWLSQLHGPGSFLNVLALLLLIGAAGAITQLRPLAVAFMGLVLLVMVLSNSGTVESATLLGKIRNQLLGNSPAPIAPLGPVLEVVK